MKKKNYFYFTEKPKFNYLARPLIKLQTRVISTTNTVFKVKMLIQSLKVGELSLKELQTTQFWPCSMLSFLQTPKNKCTQSTENDDILKMI